MRRSTKAINECNLIGKIESSLKGIKADNESIVCLIEANEADTVTAYIKPIIFMCIESIIANTHMIPSNVCIMSGQFLMERQTNGSLV